MPDELDEILRDAPPVKAGYKIRRADEILRQMMLGAAGQESNFNSQAVNRRTLATGNWQILPINIPSWTREALGRALTVEQFKNDPEAQRLTTEFHLGRYLRNNLASEADEDIAIRKTAANWYGGPGATNRYDSDWRPRPNEPSFKEYTNGVLRRTRKPSDSLAVILANAPQAGGGKFGAPTFNTANNSPAAPVVPAKPADLTGAEIPAANATINVAPDHTAATPPAQTKSGRSLVARVMRQSRRSAAPVAAPAKTKMLNTAPVIKNAVVDTPENDLVWHLGLTRAALGAYPADVQRKVAAEVSRLASNDNKARQFFGPNAVPDVSRATQENRRKKLGLNRASNYAPLPSRAAANEIEEINRRRFEGDSERIYAGKQADDARVGELLPAATPILQARYEAQRPQVEAEAQRGLRRFNQRGQIRAELEDKKNRIGAAGPGALRLPTVSRGQGVSDEEVTAEIDRRESEQRRRLAQLTEADWQEIETEAQALVGRGDVARGALSGLSGSIAATNAAGVGAGRAFGAENTWFVKDLDRRGLMRELILQRAEELKPGGAVTEIANVAGGLPLNLARLGALSKLPGGSVAGFAADAGLQTAGRGGNVDEIGREAAKGATVGFLFRGTHGWSLLPKTAVVGGGSFVVEKAFGAEAGDAAKAAFTNSIFAALPNLRAGGRRFLDRVVAMRRNGETALVRFTQQPDGNVRAENAPPGSEPAIEMEFRGGVWQPAESAPVSNSLRGLLNAAPPPKPSPLPGPAEPPPGPRAAPPTPFRVEKQGGQFVVIGENNIPEVQSFPATQKGYNQAVARALQLQEKSTLDAWQGRGLKNPLAGLQVAGDGQRAAGSQADESLPTFNTVRFGPVRVISEQNGVMPGYVRVRDGNNKIQIVPQPVELRAGVGGQRIRGNGESVPETPFMGNLSSLPKGGAASFNPAAVYSGQPPAQEATPTVRPVAVAEPPSARFQQAQELMQPRQAETAPAIREFSSTQVNLPETEARLVRDLGARLIPDEVVYTDPKDGGKGREAEPHITVKYGLHADNADAVRRILADETPVKVKLGKVSIFAGNENTPYDVVKADVDSADLRRLNKRIAAGVKVTDTHPDYKPHVTLAYVKKGEGRRFIGDASLEGREITFSSVAFSGKDGKVVDIPLGRADVQPLATVKTERGTAARIRPTVVEESDLLTSFDDGFPAEWQPRDRSRVASLAQISDIAANLEPDFLKDSPKAGEGRPLVVPVQVGDKTKYAVISGNGRTAAVRMAYANQNEGAARYRESLGPAAVSVDKPVYVGVLDPQENQGLDLRSFANESNEQSVAAMSATEQAQADARHLDGGLLSAFYPNEEGDFLTTANAPFLRGFSERAIGTAERGRFVTERGEWSGDGVRRIRNAVFARAFGDTPAGENLLANVAESNAPEIRNISNVLLRKAGQLVALRQAVADGVRHSLDITAEVASAANKLAELRRQKTSVADYLRQGRFDGPELSPLAENLLRVFDEYKREPKTIAGIIDNYLTIADALGDPRQGSLMNLSVPTPEEAFEAAYNQYKKGVHVETENLFRNAESGGQPESEVSRQQTADGEVAPGNGENVRAVAAGTGAANRLTRERPGLARSKPLADDELDAATYYLDELRNIEAHPHRDILRRSAFEYDESSRSLLVNEETLEYLRRLEFEAFADEAEPATRMGVYYPSGAATRLIDFLNDNLSLVPVGKDKAILENLLKILRQAQKSGFHRDIVVSLDAAAATLQEERGHRASNNSLNGLVYHERPGAKLLAEGDELMARAAQKVAEIYAEVEPAELAEEVTAKLNRDDVETHLGLTVAEADELQKRIFLRLFAESGRPANELEQYFYDISQRTRQNFRDAEREYAAGAVSSGNPPADENDVLPGRTNHDRPAVFGRLQANGKDGQNSLLVSGLNRPLLARAAPAGPLTPLRRAAEKAAGVANLPRALKSSVDFSAPLRQGAILTVVEPKLAFQSLGKMFSAVKRDNFEQIGRDLDLHPMIELAEQSGLYLSSLSAKAAQSAGQNNLSQREEAFMSRLAEKIPWVRISEQAYTAYLDTLRMGAFAQYARAIHEYNVKKGREDDAAQYEGIARWINYATGRGDLGRLNDAAPILNGLFFSSRYWASRLQVLNPVFYAKLPPGARKIAVQKMLTAIGVMGLTLLLAKLAGFEVELTDYNSPDWLKIKRGDWRWDIAAGTQQNLRFLLRMGTEIVGGLHKTATMTPEERKKADGYKKDGAGGILLKMLRNKLNPTVGAAVNLYTGQNPVGEPVTFKGQAADLVTPLMLNEFYEGYKAEGLAGVGKASPGIFGVGTQHYKPRPAKAEKGKPAKKAAPLF